jgi:hypothetical protein
MPIALGALGYGLPQTASSLWSSKRVSTALAHTFLRGRTHRGSPGLWLGLHAVEVCHPRSDTPGQTRQRGVGRNRATLAPRDELGVVTQRSEIFRSLDLLEIVSPRLRLHCLYRYAVLLSVTLSHLVGNC